MREQRCWVNTQLRNFLLWQCQRPGSAHRIPCCLTSKGWSLEGEKEYIALKSHDPIVRLLKGLDIVGWEMHEDYLIADIIKLKEFILYPTRAHQWSMSFRLTVANSTRLGSGLGKLSGNIQAHLSSTCMKCLCISVNLTTVWFHFSQRIEDAPLKTNGISYTVQAEPYHHYKIMWLKHRT